MTYSTREPPTVPLESNSSENLQDVEENISIDAQAPRWLSRPRIPNKKLVNFLLTENSEIMILENSERTTYRQALTIPNFEK